MVCRPATSEAGARRPAGAINCIWTTYLENYLNYSTLGNKVSAQIFYVFRDTLSRMPSSDKSRFELIQIGGHAGDID
jgi:hypothetical protein